MIHPEGLCLAKVRAAPGPAGSGRKAERRGIPLHRPAVRRGRTYGPASGSTSPAVLWNQLKDEVSALILNCLAMVG